MQQRHEVVGIEAAVDFELAQVAYVDLRNLVYFVVLSKGDGVADGELVEPEHEELHLVVGARRPARRLVLRLVC